MAAFRGRKGRVMDELLGNGSLITWIPFCIYYIATIPQIITNYRNQTTEGLSYRMVFLDYTGAMSTTIYTFLLGLPFACRVMEPLCMINIGILAAQGFYYTKQKEIRRNMFWGYMGIHLFGMTAFLIGGTHGHFVGHAMGWFSLIVQSFTQLPQVLKNRRRKSVNGLNFLYITLLGIAGLLELTIAQILSLPKQTFLNGLRGVIYYSILCYQFWQYRWSKKKNLVRKKARARAS